MSINHRAIERQAKDREFIERRQDDWPCWPVLPMKAASGDFHGPRAFGILHCGNVTRLYFTSTYALAERVPVAKTWVEALKSVEYKDYPDLNALLAEYCVD